jgi:hypothetical protein
LTTNLTNLTNGFGVAAFSSPLFVGFVRFVVILDRLTALRRFRESLAPASAGESGGRWVSASFNPRYTSSA